MKDKLLETIPFIFKPKVKSETKLKYKYTTRLTEIVRQLHFKWDRFVNNIADRYHYLAAETLTIGLSACWILIEIWLRWPKVSFLINSGGVSQLPNPYDPAWGFNLFMIFYPLLGFSVVIISVSIACIATLRFTHNLAKGNFVQDLTLTTILERKDTLALSTKIDSIELEELDDGATELTQADMVYLYQMLTKDKYDI